MKYIISRTSGYAPHDDAKEIELVYEAEGKLIKWDEDWSHIYLDYGPIFGWNS